MKSKLPYILLATISLFFLIIITISSVLLLYLYHYKTPVLKTSETIYVYVEEETTDVESTPPSARWFVVEHNEKIGIFNEDGDLVEIIETYTKALPKADRTTLQEGFWIESQQELYSVIEAYTD